MRSDGDASREPRGVTGERFAGDLFLRLANEGWLVVGSEQADHVIAELERTLDAVRAYLRRVELSRKLRDAADGITPDVDRLVVQAAFEGQVAAGTWEQALVELPKYIQAFRIAAAQR
ncbi:hypothetical protein [Saccharothrix coeruleofusca]|uniref:Uncharacterized protein n=1 Tax=Saccharothrix coeruleofusca TaxID=33919 RepID=A0A918AS70_9PSEU|nr:hypothetical protein [Saccharothrix coeruleofusca]MBP2335944.1 hypothetical protein [Saccharothrix coeruleofusca]GGP76442.1 hypothetical protein GCM10010185_57710 [Saccharothrix coeruleofusca]